MEEIQVPKGTKTLVTYTKPERWAKFAGVFLTGFMSLWGYQKIPMVRESARITEAVQVVKSLEPDQINAIQGMQVVALEKQVRQNLDVQVAAINDLKLEIRTLLKDYDDRTTKRLDKNSDLILNNIKSIARLEGMISKAQASQ